MSGASPESSNLENRDEGPRRVDWVLHGADRLLTCDTLMTCIPDGAIAIHGDRIVGVGPTEAIRSTFQGSNEMDLGGYLLAPGLVNTHTHAAMSCFRGLGDDLPLDRWLFEVIFPAEAAHVNSKLVYWGTLLSIVEMLKNGITTFCDGYFFEEAAVAAALRSGMRAILGQGILDFPSPDQPDPSRSRERARTFLESFPPVHERVRASLFCHAPYTCGPETLQWVKEMCRDQGLLFQIHLSETAREVKELEEKHGRPPVEYLDGLNILDDKTLCIHGIWLEDSEMALLSERKTGVSHAVESNMKLGSGIARVPELLARGVKVGLGTDGCASNNDLDLFGEMDRMAKLHKVERRDPEACPAAQVLRAATLGGAEVLGWAEDIGSLECGKRADIMAIDLNQPHLIPLFDPISHMVYSVKGSDVRHVWVGGIQVVRGGELLSLDETEIVREVVDLCRKIGKR